jgi:hypothetical protein
MQPHEVVGIGIATSEEQILPTRDVMLQLRPAVPSQEYLPTVRHMQAYGFMKLVIDDHGKSWPM